MSGEMSATATSLGRLTSLLNRTTIAIGGSLSRWDGRAILGVTSLGYLALYMIGIGHLGRGDGTVDAIVVADPLARLTDQVAPFQYEPIAFVALGPIEMLLAPVNLALGGLLAVLVGLNLAVSWVAWRGPAACRIGPGAGLTAGVPGILSGFVCCGPTILLVVGVQASAGLLAAFQWFFPAAVVLLLVTLVWVGSKVDPA